MVEKKKQEKKVDKKEDKVKRVSTAIANLELGESISPTRLFREIADIHPDLGRDILDLHDSLKEIGFKTLRDKNGKVREIIRTDESLNIRNDIRDIKKEILGLKSIIDELNTNLKNKK
jgi:hypothetical protein